jgi:hypothetical protein
MKQKARAKAIKFTHRGIYKGIPIVDPGANGEVLPGQSHEILDIACRS